MKKLFIIPLLIGFITAIGCSNNSNQGATQEETNAIEASKEQVKVIFEDVDVYVFAELVAKKQGQILDVRTKDEWAEGTIKGAIKMNYYDDDFANKLTTLNKNKPVYVYCKSGGRSAKAARLMQEMGFKQIFNLLGGFKAWNGAGKEVVK
jgi:rhodanese-related sulfurtransferase